jgi:hypothetical protein
MPCIQTLDFEDKHILIIIFTINWISKYGRLDNIPKCCFENFPSLSSHQKHNRVIILNAKFQLLYRKLRLNPAHIFVFPKVSLFSDWHFLNKYILEN